MKNSLEKQQSTQQSSDGYIRSDEIDQTVFRSLVWGLIFGSVAGLFMSSIVLMAIHFGFMITFSMTMVCAALMTLLPRKKQHKGTHKAIYGEIFFMGFFITLVLCMAMLGHFLPLYVKGGFLR